MASYELQPMSVGEILDAALSIYRDHFGTLVAIMVICQGVPAVMSVYVTGAGGVQTYPGVWLAAVLLSWVGGLFSTGATIWVISEAYLGSEPTAADALRFAVGKAWRIFIAGLAKYLVIGLATMVPVTLAMVGIAAAVQSAVAILYVLAVLIGGIWLGLVLAAGYSVVLPAVVLEPLPGATDSLGRSWHLTKGSRGRAIILGLVTFVFILLPFIVAGAVAAMFPATQTTVRVAAEVVYPILYPIVACAFTLLYYDLRVRKEAFDLQHLSAQLGLEPEASLG